MRCFAEISVLVHATEDLDKVVETLRAFLGDLPYVIEKLEGHYGNPIYLITAFLQDCRPLLEKICPHVQPPQMQHGEWYIRLDKQKLVRGIIAQSSSDDVVRIRIRGGGCGDN